MIEPAVGREATGESSIRQARQILLTPNASAPTEEIQHDGWMAIKATLETPQLEGSPRERGNPNPSADDSQKRPRARCPFSRFVYAIPVTCPRLFIACLQNTDALCTLSITWHSVVIGGCCARCRQVHFIAVWRGYYGASLKRFGTKALKAPPCK